MKRQPTADEKTDFIKQLALAEDPKTTPTVKAEAEAKLKTYLAEFDCGCKFRDALFKKAYQSVLRGNRKSAIVAAKLLVTSFKYESIRGLLRGLNG